MVERQRCQSISVATLMGLAMGLNHLRLRNRTREPSGDFASRACASVIDRHFPTQRKMFFSSANILRAEPRMNQFTFVVLTVLGLALASYFGLAAWRVSDSHAEITGTILPNHR
jgi:hypothetical protein